MTKRKIPTLKEMEQAEELARIREVTCSRCGENKELHYRVNEIEISGIILICRSSTFY